MTRKDFILIARIIRDMEGTACPTMEARERIAEAFADSLREVNGQFKRELFIQAATGQCPLNARVAR